MRHQKLSEKITNIKTASQFQHKLIDSIYGIMVLKRKAENQYKLALDNIAKEVDQYIGNQNGFLSEIMKSFYSYISVLQQNQANLVEGYDEEILNYLIEAKQSQFQKSIVEKAEFVDAKIQECQDKIRQAKKSIKQNEEEIQLILNEFRFKAKIKDRLTQQEEKRYGEQINNLRNAKKTNEDILEQHVDGMMNLTMLHNQAVEDLDEYEKTYLQKKANDVFDNFMRAFILEVSFLKSLQNDVKNILKKVNQDRDECKRLELEGLRKRMDKDKGIKAALWESYKKWTTSEYDIDISENYINPKIKDKWKRVCDYYNQAKC